MDDPKIIKELNKILTFEHVHLGMYSKFHHPDKEIKSALKRFINLEKVHITTIRKVILNLGGNPIIITESGDLIGKLFGVTLNLTDIMTTLQGYTFIEKKSHQGYQTFINQLKQDDLSKNEQIVSELVFPNMLDAELMSLWLDKTIQLIQ